MTWLCVNIDNSETVCSSKPERVMKYGFWESLESIEGETVDFTIELPNGSIEKLIGRQLSWQDNCVEI
jgi:hypothetical protein